MISRENWASFGLDLLGTARLLSESKDGIE